MNRRVQGRVKQARKRMQKRIDIRAGRRMSMQQLMHSHAEQVVEETPLAEGTHELVNKETGQVLQRGTESQMRKQRAQLGADSHSVRKVKVAA
jgi:hypothetical protein